MSGRYLLDTNIIIDLLADVEAVKAMLGEAEEAFAPSIAIGELYYGAEKSTRPGENVGRIEISPHRYAAKSSMRLQFAIPKPLFRAKSGVIVDNQMAMKGVP